MSTRQNEILVILLLAVNSVFAQVEHEATFTPDKSAKKDTLLTVTEEEINQAMQFGIKEKVTAIATGSFGGAIVGFFIGRTLTYTKIDPLDQTGGILLGMTAGIIIGPIINYSLTYHAIKRDTKKQLIERKKKARHESCLQFDLQFRVQCSTQSMYSFADMVTFIPTLEARILF